MIIGGIFGTIWATVKGIQLAETITTALQGRKLGLAAKEFFIKSNGNALAAVDLAREEGKLSFKQLGVALEKESLLVKMRAYGVALQEWTVAKWKQITGTQQLATDQADLATQQSQNIVANEGLLIKTRKFLVSTKDYAMEKGTALIQKLQIAYENISLSLKQKGLALTIKDFMKSIGQAAMKAYQSAAAIPVVGWILGAAAAAAVVGLGMKLMSKGDDVVSPGYGKRTLMAPEGAIALNDKDTVIAGTDLGGKGKGSGINKSAGPSIDLTPMINAINATTAAINGLMDRPTNVFLDGIQLSQKLQAPMAVTTRKTG